MNISLKHTCLLIFFAALFCAGCQENRFSDEMVEQFFMMNKNLKDNNRVVQYSIENLHQELSEFANQRVQYLPLVEISTNANKKVRKFNDYIDSLRTLLVQKSGGFYSQEDAEKQGNTALEGRPIDPRNTVAPYDIFIAKNENSISHGMIIHEEIQKLKNTLLQLVENLWDNGGIKGSVFGNLEKKGMVMQELKNEFFIEGIDDYHAKAFGDKTWAEFMFENKPLAAIYPLLRKLQNDALSLELALVAFLISKQQAGRCTYGMDSDKLLALDSPKQILLGETYEAEIVIGRYVSTASSLVSIDNQIIKSNDGKTIYQTKPTSIGKKKYTARVAFKNPLTGEIMTMTRDFYYEVVEK